MFTNKGLNKTVADLELVFGKHNTHLPAHTGVCLASLTPNHTQTAALHKLTESRPANSYDVPQSVAHEIPRNRNETRAPRWHMIQHVESIMLACCNRFVFELLHIAVLLRDKTKHSNAACSTNVCACTGLRSLALVTNQQPPPTNHQPSIIHPPPTSRQPHHHTTSIFLHFLPGACEILRSVCHPWTYTYVVKTEVQTNQASQSMFSDGRCICTRDDATCNV